MPCVINLGNVLFLVLNISGFNCNFQKTKILDKDVSRHYLQIKKMLITIFPLHSHIHRQEMLAIIAYKFGLDKGFLPVLSII